MRYVRSTKEHGLAVVQGPSPHGDQYRTIVYKCGATEVVYYCASIKRLTAVWATPPPPAEARVQPAEVQLPKSVWQLPSTLHAFSQPCVLPPNNILFHWQATRPHKIDPLSPQWQRMLWLWNAKKILQSGDPKPFDSRGLGKVCLGNLGLGHTFGDNLYFTRDILEETKSSKSWWHQQVLNLHPNLHPNMESNLQPSVV